MAVDEGVYLTVDRHRVLRMTKSMPELKRGELPILLHVRVADSAFGKPTIEFDVDVRDPFGGLDMSDLEITRRTISPEELEILKTRRIELMRQILRDQGDTVIPADELLLDPES